MGGSREGEEGRWRRMKPDGDIASTILLLMPIENRNMDQYMYLESADRYSFSAIAKGERNR